MRFKPAEEVRRFARSELGRGPAVTGSRGPILVRRYVAIGDSSTEGLGDPDGRGGWRGWADRLAERFGQRDDSFRYANLAIRGRTTRAVLEEQLAPALAMEPDLLSVFVGTNDLFERDFDAERVAADIEHMHRAAMSAGAHVISFTLPDLSPIMPIARLLRRRVAELNRAHLTVAARTGATIVPMHEQPLAADPRLWSPDRLHVNEQGHERIAAALGAALGLDDCEGWDHPMPPFSRSPVWVRGAREVIWFGRWMLPWSVCHLMGRSEGDGVVAKRPELSPVP